MFSTPGREEMFNREEMDWNIYQYYDVKMFRPDSSEGFLQPSSSLAALNDSEDIMKTMIKRERNRVEMKGAGSGVGLGPIRYQTSEGSQSTQLHI